MELLRDYLAVAERTLPGDETEPAPPPAVRGETSSSSLTPEAQELLAKVESGAVPTAVTGNLERIARENGVTVSPDMTPNRVIEELRRKV